MFQLSTRLRRTVVRSRHKLRGELPWSSLSCPSLSSPTPLSLPFGRVSYSVSLALFLPFSLFFTPLPALTHSLTLSLCICTCIVRVLFIRMGTLSSPFPSRFGLAIPLRDSAVENQWPHFTTPDTDIYCISLGAAHLRSRHKGGSFLSSRTSLRSRTGLR